MEKETENGEKERKEQKMEKKKDRRINVMGRCTKKGTEMEKKGERNRKREKGTENGEKEGQKDQRDGQAYKKMSYVMQFFRAVDSHSFFADPDPAIFSMRLLNRMRIRIYKTAG